MMLEEMLKDEREAGRLEGEKIGEKRGRKAVIGIGQCFGKSGTL